MNIFLNNKSELESLLKIADSTKEYYTKKRLNLIMGVNEETIPKVDFNDTSTTSIKEIENRYESKEYKMYSDSVKKYSNILNEYQVSLKQVNYSIDSLLKLK